MCKIRYATPICTKCKSKGESEEWRGKVSATMKAVKSRIMSDCRKVTADLACSDPKEELYMIIAGTSTLTLMLLCGKMLPPLT